jgi:hypothetical protein
MALHENISTIGQCSKSCSISKIHFSSWMIYPFACAFAVIGAKCWMIDRYGSPTPFWDQWDAEGDFLYPRFLGGTLHFSDLIAPHAEHRILATRLWSLLLLLELEGYWDPTLQMLGAILFVLGLAVHRRRREMKPAPSRT